MRVNSVFSISLSRREQSPSSLFTRLFVSSKTKDETNLRMAERAERVQQAPTLQAEPFLKVHMLCTEKRASFSV